MSERQITFQKIQSVLDTEELASLGPEPRANRDPLPMLEDRLRQIFFEAKIPESAQPLIRSLVLLWHDYLDQSHSISQDIQSADGSFLHGIMHRREPDYENAKYWFHRVREHPCFPDIATRAEKILHDANATNLKTKLIHAGNWDAFAFVNACENALLKNDKASITLLKQIQEIEFITLLEHFLREPLSQTK